MSHAISLPSDNLHPALHLRSRDAIRHLHPISHRSDGPFSSRSPDLPKRSLPRAHWQSSGRLEFSSFSCTWAAGLLRPHIPLFASISELMFTRKIRISLLYLSFDFNHLTTSETPLRLNRYPLLVILKFPKLSNSDFSSVLLIFYRSINQHYANFFQNFPMIYTCALPHVCVQILLACRSIRRSAILFRRHVTFAHHITTLFR